MSIGDEGQFRFTNGTAIDSGLNKDRILDVINHEFTHSLLYSTTSYGQFVMMLEKNGILDDRSNVIKNDSSLGCVVQKIGSKPHKT